MQSRLTWIGVICLLLITDWHYNKGYVDISMVEYVTKELENLQHQNQNDRNIPYIAGQYLLTANDYIWNQGLIKVN